MSQTISSFLSEHLSDKKAIGALNKKWLSYGALRELKKDVHKALRKNGIANRIVLQLCFLMDQRWLPPL